LKNKIKLNKSKKLFTSSNSNIRKIVKEINNENDDNKMKPDSDSVNEDFVQIEEKVKKTEITMKQMEKELGEKKQKLKNIIKYKLNLTNKQLRRKYYPEKKLSTLKKDKINFYKQIIDKGKRNIISIDETSLYLNMMKNNGRCEKGKRCYKTIHTYPFVKFNFICAIKYGKVIEYKLYEKDKGGIDNIRQSRNLHNVIMIS